MKKIIFMITTFIIILFTGITLIPANVTANNTKWYVGDVNRDDKVDAIDASLILHYYATISSGKDLEKNAQISDDLWETVIKDKNISEFN